MEGALDIRSGAELLPQAVHNSIKRPKRRGNDVAGCDALKRGIVKGKDEMAVCVEFFRTVIRVDSVHPLEAPNPRGILDLVCVVGAQPPGRQRVA